MKTGKKQEKLRKSFKKNNNSETVSDSIAYKIDLN